MHFENHTCSNIEPRQKRETAFEIAVTPDRLSFFFYYGSSSSSTSFATTSDGVRGGIAIASDRLKQEGRGVDCKAGLDVKPGSDGGDGGGGVRLAFRSWHTRTPTINMMFFSCS